MQNKPSTANGKETGQKGKKKKHTMGKEISQNKKIIPLL